MYRLIAWSALSTSDINYGRIVEILKSFSPWNSYSTAWTVES